MTNEYYELCSNSTKQCVHYNHGWWCTECTNHLFEIDEQTDHTGEWIEVIRQWAEIAMHCLWSGLIQFGSAVITVILGLAWILFCFIEGVESDTRIYEQQLTEKDGLGRKARDELNCSYNEVLKERQQLLKEIDICKSNMRFDLGERQYRIDQKELREKQQELDLVNARLIDFERELRIYKGV
jgi:hypothetical protein